MSLIQSKAKIYSVISQKGEAGKTTLVINLAVQSNLQTNNSLIVDFDPHTNSRQNIRYYLIKL